MRDAHGIDADLPGEVAQIRRAVKIEAADDRVILIISLTETRHLVLERVAVIVDLRVAHGGLPLHECTEERVDPVAPAGADGKHFRFGILLGEIRAGLGCLLRGEQVAFVQYNEIRLPQLGILNVRHVASITELRDGRWFD